MYKSYNYRLYEEKLFIYIVNRDNNNNKIDSTVITGSTFTFTGKIATPAFCQITASREYYVSFILENGTINLDLGKPELPSGTSLNKELANFRTAQNKMSDMIDSKQRELMEQIEDKKNVCSNKAIISRMNGNQLLSLCSTVSSIKTQIIRSEQSL